MVSTDRIRAFYLAWYLKGPVAYPLIGNGLLALNKTPEGTLFYLSRVSVSVPRLLSSYITMIKIFVQLDVLHSWLINLRPP